MPSPYNTLSKPSNLTAKRYGSSLGAASAATLNRLGKAVAWQGDRSTITAYC